MNHQATAAPIDVSDVVPSWRPGGRHLAGIVLATLSLVPLYRLLGRPDTGLAGAATSSLAGADAAFVWSGFLVLLGLSLVVALVLPPDRFRWAADVGASLISRPSGGAWSIGAALVAGSGAVMFSILVLDGQPNLIDAMSQLLHARFVAAGEMAGPGPELGAFWTVQQSVFTPRGWVSQYPPGHVLALAAGFGAGAVWLVGPLLLAAAVALLVPVSARLLPDSPVAARVAVVVVAISPFVLAHAGAFSSHTTALALGVAAVYCVLRGGRGSPLWSVAAGAFLGAMLATRPLSAIGLGLAIAFFLPFERKDLGSRLRSLALMSAGAVPFVVGLGLYNAALFGSPLRWGYEAALGPAAGPGFGVDPWGNSYGPLEAIAYVSAELSSLNLHLLGSPLPVVAVLSLFLVTSNRLTTGDRFLAAWALLPLALHMTYWHHGLFMGPRMLNEMAPAWCLLGTRAAFSLTARAPERVARLHMSPRVLAGTLFALSLAGALYFGPERLWSYRQRPQAPAAARATMAPALVFVHGGWTSRVAMRLAAAGMRLDSVETALRQNPTCEVQAYADARAHGRPLPDIDFAARATGLPPVAELSPGNRIRIAPGSALPPRCAMQAAADRFGALDVSPLLWRGDLPEGSGTGTLFVRDLGPSDNARLIARYSDRTAYVLMSTAPDGPPELVPYAVGMALLWGAA